MSKGILLVISGPSGVGKGTVVKELLRKYDDILLSVSVTTRGIRGKEKEAVDYYFISREQFSQMIANDQLLEYAQYNGDFYGTPADKVWKQLDKGGHMLLEIDVQGGRQIKSKLPETVLIFMTAPLDTIRARLTGRGTETEAVIEQRMSIAPQELAQANGYDYIVENDVLEDTVLRIREIIDLESNREDN